MKRVLFLIVLASLTTPAAAQQGAAQPAPRAGMAPNAAVSTTAALWRMMSGYVLRAAEQMPESEYGYKPTPEVRSFGQMIGHVAGAQYMFCAAALGDSARAEDDIERSRTTKAELVQALRESSEYCTRAYAQTDVDAMQPIQLFGQPQTRYYALTMNATHDGEHYGNLVTYLRMKGMVPPSSQPRN